MLARGEPIATDATIDDGAGPVPYVRLEPVLVTRIEDRSGQVLEEFAPVAPEAALDPGVAYTLLDVMRGVVARGTGTAIRNTFGLRAALAGWLADPRLAAWEISEYNPIHDPERRTGELVLALLPAKARLYPEQLAADRPVAAQQQLYAQARQLMQEQQQQSA